MDASKKRIAELEKDLEQCEHLQEKLDKELGDLEAEDTILKKEKDELEAKCGSIEREKKNCESDFIEKRKNLNALVYSKEEAEAEEKRAAEAKEKLEQLAVLRQESKEVSKTIKDTRNVLFHSSKINSKIEKTYPFYKNVVQESRAEFFFQSASIFCQHLLIYLSYDSKCFSSVKIRS